MLRLYKLKVPAHKVGKSSRFDFPIAGNGNMVVGAFAVCGNGEVKAKLSIATDGRIVIPSIRVVGDPSVRSTAKNMVVPVDFEKMGNKITFVIEEYIDGYSLDGKKVKDVEYTIDVYVKSKER